MLAAKSKTIDRGGIEQLCRRLFCVPGVMVFALFPSFTRGRNVGSQNYLQILLLYGMMTGMRLLRDCRAAVIPRILYHLLFGRMAETVLRRSS